MRLSWRASSRTEDQFESWLTQHQQARVLAADTPPGLCPDASFLRDLARRSKNVSLSDPRIDHAATCPRCMTSLLAFRRSAGARQRRMGLAAAIGACAAVAVAAFFALHFGSIPSQRMNDTASLSKTLDLSNAGTYRGDQPAPLQSVTLPAALVRVHVILPRFSPPGAYQLAVKRDQAGTDVLAQASASTVTHGTQEELSVSLDLRKAHTGLYFISTTHEQDQASYYYPLRIR